jgi:hypothetical protein
MFVSCTVFVLSGRGLSSSRGVVPTVVCVWMWSNENKKPSTPTVNK